MATFKYFGYASNLLEERIRVGCPTVKFCTIAKLKDYKFSFNNAPDFESPWQGSTANILPSPGDVTWGAVWEIGTQYIDALNREDAVDRGIYRNIEVQVETPEGEKISCRCLEMCSPLPEVGFPSPQYLSVIVDGAVQRGLPEDYIKMLKSTPHNGFTGEVAIMEEIKEKGKNTHPL
ncbi:gamma-glutamylcyclotransferase-like [Ptychodera flava]|uniref:gamma-glutamylcyclotransferase-like n=1 Tax=Ptychodera flava TaxID=63121 RepID=UPI003969F19F